MTGKQTPFTCLSRLLLLMFTTSLFFSAAVGQAAADGKYPRYHRLPEEFHDFIQEMEDQHGDLIDLWVEARNIRDRLGEQMMVLGRRSRRDAETAIRGLERDFERSSARFRQQKERTKRSYERRFERLQEEIWNRQEAMDPTDMENFYLQQEQIQELRQQTIEAEKPVRTLDAMDRVLNFDLPEPYQTARLPGGRRDGPRNFNYLERNQPRLLGARMDLLDHFADIERLLEKKKGAGQGWSPRDENELTSLIGSARRTWAGLEDQIDRSLRNELRDLERLKQDIERLENRKEGRSGRAYERAVEQLSEAQIKLEEQEELIERHRILLNFPSQYDEIINMVSTE